MSTLPRISIVTSCYNHENFIERTIRSVLDQRYPNLEFVVVNDGSTDNSGEIIRRFQDEISRYIELSDFRPSPVFALNRAFETVSGDILGWLNSDDILLPKSLFVVAQVFQDLPEAAWITGQASTINGRDEIVNTRVRRKTKLDFLNGDWAVIQQESTFFRRSIWENSGAKLDETWAFDTELWTRFFENEELVHVDAPLGAFRRGSQSRSTRNRSEFLSHSDAKIDGMRSRASFGDRLSSLLWKGWQVRPLAQLMRAVPNRLLVLFFPKMSELVASYVFEEDRWQMSRRSSFKRPQ